MESQKDLQSLYQVAMEGYPTDEELVMLNPSEERMNKLIHLGYLMYMRNFGLPLGTPGYEGITEKTLIAGETGIEITDAILNDLGHIVLTRIQDPDFSRKFQDTWKVAEDRANANNANPMNVLFGDMLTAAQFLAERGLYVFMPSKVPSSFK